MFCDLNPTDTIALRALGVSIGVFILLTAHAVIFWIQAGSLKRSVTDSRDKEQRELRAYVFPKMVAMNFANSIPTVDVHLMNFGKTPAFNMFGGVMLRLGNITQILEFPEHPTTGFLMTIPPGGEIHQTDSINVNPHQLSELVAGHLRVYIHGFIGYVDIFNNRQFYEFTSFHGSPETGPFGTTPNVSVLNDNNQTNGRDIPRPFP